MRKKIPVLKLLILMIGSVSCLHRAPTPVSAPVPSAPVISAEEKSEYYYAVLKAHYLADVGRISEALGIFEDLIQRPDASPDLFIHVAQLYEEFVPYVETDRQAERLFDQAISIADEGLRRFPEHAAIQQLLIQLYIDSGRYFSAITRLEQWLEKHPDDDTHRVQLARLYNQVNKPNRAVELLVPMLKKDFVDPEIVRTLALAYAKAGQYADAIRYYESYLKDHQKDYEARYNYAMVYIHAKDYQSAKRVLEDMLEDFPDAADVRWRLTEIYQKEFRYEAAVEVLKPLLLNSLFEQKARVEIGRLLLLAGQPENAEKQLRIALETEPDRPTILFYLAIALADQKKLEDALNVLDPLLKKEDVPVPVVDLAGQLLTETGRFVDALRLTESAVDAHPDDPNVYKMLGELYESRHYLEKAIEVYRRGLKRFPRQEDLTLRLAILLSETDRWREAVELVEPLLKAQPDNPRLNNFIGFVLADNGVDLSRAEKLIKIALEKEPDNPAYLDSMGWVYYKLGNYDKALIFLMSALESGIGDPEILQHLADVYVKLGQMDKAEKILTKLLEQNPDDARLRARLDALRSDRSKNDSDTAEPQ